MPKLGGGVEGFNIDLVNEAGRRMGRKVEIFAAEFSGLIPAMQAGKIDFVGAPTVHAGAREAAALRRRLSQHLPGRRGRGGPTSSRSTSSRQGGVLEQGLGLRQVAAGQLGQARPEGRRVLRRQRRCHAGGDLGPRRCRPYREHRRSVCCLRNKNQLKLGAPESRPGPRLGR